MARAAAANWDHDELRSVVDSLRLPDVPAEVLVGIDTGDDATVWRVDDDRAIVATLDFFTPIVDDPYDWGRIAATNAMSDVYAMGGAPFLALNIAAWPVDDLPLSMLTSVLQGGVEAAAKAGVAVLGGHSITDPEPKYGMVVLGFVHPERLLTNAGAQPGDRLFLTKPIGLGMISTAAKRGVASGEQLVAALDTMTMLNADAADAMNEADGTHAATDVTGFGLARPPAHDAVRPAGSRRASTPAPCPCYRACSTWPAATSWPAVPSGTTPGSRRRPTGATAPCPSSICSPMRRRAAVC